MNHSDIITIDQIATMTGVNLIVSVPGAGITTTFLTMSSGQNATTLMLDCNYNIQHFVKMPGSHSGSSRTSNIFTIDTYATHVYQRHHKRTSINNIVNNKYFKRQVKRIAKQYDVESKALYQLYHNQLTTQPDESLNKAVVKLKRAYKNYKSKNNFVDYDEVYAYILQQPKMLNKHLRKFDRIVVDNVHNVTERQAKLIVQLSKYVSTLIVAGDPCQSISSTDGHYSASWEYLKLQLTPKQYFITTSFRIGHKQVKLINDMRKEIGLGLPVKPVNDSTKLQPLYRSFATVEDQNDYLVSKILQLQAKGVDLNCIAIVARTKAQLLPVKFALSRPSELEQPIPTYDGFINHGNFKECYQALFALIRITWSMHRSDEWPHEDDLRCLIQFVGLDNQQQMELFQKVTQNGIPEFEIKKTTIHRQLYDRILGLKNAMTKASTIIESEFGVSVQMLIDALFPIINNQYDNHTVIVAMLKRLRLSMTSYDCLRDIENGIRTTYSKSGVNLRTCHGVIGREFEYLFLINVVDCNFPYTKYSRNTSEHHLLFNSITRATLRTTILRTPISGFNFQNDKDASKSNLRRNTLLKDSRYLEDYKTSSYFKIDITNQKKVQQQIRDVYHK